MIIKPGFLLLLLLCWPTMSMASVDTSSISAAEDIQDAASAAETELEKLQITSEQKATAKDKLRTAKEEALAIPCSEEEPAESDDNDKSDQNSDERSEEDKKKALEEKTAAYNAAHENEQSLANRTLTAVTTAATGIGGMELARGLAEQTADKNADASMDAYIATFRCTYGNGKQVKAGPEEIELPGGNDQNMMNLRAQYFALANDLKERKAALGMEPGIESEVILDKSQMGLYDDENIGITGGAYESLYRAKMLNSETDQTKIDEMADASKKRVMGGAIAAGAGAVVGVLGDSLINGELGERIKARKADKETQKKLRELEEKTKGINIEMGPDFEAALQELEQKYKN